MLKRYGCVGTLIGIVGLVTILFITLRPRPPECLRYGKEPTLQAGHMPLPNNLAPLQAANLKDLKRIVRLSPHKNLADYYFTLKFSADDTLLAIYGAGYPREMISTTLLWKLKHPELCVLEAGDYTINSYRNRFEAFSPDSQFVLLNKCSGERRATLVV